MASVLVIEDDPVIADLVHIALTDEGHQVASLGTTRPNAIRAAVGQLEPDCILLDWESTVAYGGSWASAAWLRGRERPVPTIMFTAHASEADEARLGKSARSAAAAFAAVLPKPFELDELLDAVARTVGSPAPFDRSGSAEQARTAALMERLQAAGARDIHPSTRREWATFRTADGTLVQLYWWQRDGVYYVLRYSSSGETAERVGQFYDLDAAILLAMTVAGEPSDEGT